ncbi:hypothetical protein [Aquabacterium sp. CECT 9606]|uniref:hypothetical protein n=1 Tax=Aquabacterium sp. CECT 9606 TaxID=2845822 RepID=UPI001E35BBED|nr:hypothetical protein [Aquabacterium sp. CECT 9606]
MSNSSTRPRPRPSLAQTTRLVSRALGMSAEELTASVRHAVWSDLPAILALRTRVIGTDIDWDDQAYMAWRYRLGRPQAGGGECWVLVRDGALLGMVGTQDLVLQCGGQSCPALSLMDILIQPELESVGLGVWLNLFIQAQTTATLAIGANANSIGMVSRLFDTLPNRRSFVHPVKLGHFLRKRLPVPGLPQLMAMGLETMMRLGRALLLAPWLPSSIQIKPWARLDDALNALNAQLETNEVVHAERTPAQLNWRLLDNPRGASQVWGAWSKGRLVGYMATQLTPLDDGRQALTIVDLVVPLPIGRPALRALLWTALEEAWRHQVEYVTMTSYRQDVERELRRAGFRQQAHQFETLGWTCGDDGFKALVEARADWTLSEVHTDRV